MAAVCKTWSLSSERKFQGLCSMPLKAETANNTTQCQACVVPVEVPCSGSAGFGTTDWVWDYTPESYWAELGWVISADHCECAGRPVTPSSPGTTVGDAATTDCERD